MGVAPLGTGSGKRHHPHPWPLPTRGSGMRLQSLPMNEVPRPQPDAVPEGVCELIVQVVDKNGKDLAVLAEWTVTLL